MGGGVVVVGGPPRQGQQRHVHDSIRPIRLTVALGQKIPKQTKCGGGIDLSDIKDGGKSGKTDGRFPKTTKRK